MYKITYEGRVIHDPRLDDRELLQATASLAVNEPGELSLTLPATHPELSSLQFMKGTAELTESGVPIFRGRIIREPSLDFYNNHEITIEGVLGYFNDSVIPPFNFPEDFLQLPEYRAAASSGNVVEYFLGWLIGQHNSQVTPEQRLLLGNVTVRDTNNYITRSASDFASTWATIKDKLFGSSLGGHLDVRYTADGNYVDYLADYPLTNTQPIEYGQNLLDLVRETDGTELFTAVLPVGKDGLTIADLPDGEIVEGVYKQGNILLNAERVAAFGSITRIMKWDDVTLPENLLTRAQEALVGAGLARTITAKACDLGLTEEQTASLRVGRMQPIASPPHGLASSYPLLALGIDILDPAGTEVTLSHTEKTLTGSQQATQERLDSQEMELNRQEKDTAELIQATREQLTQAIQTSERIIFEAMERYVETGDFEEYKQTVTTQLSVQAGIIEMNFATLTQEITDVNGDLQAKYNERVRYIRFDDGSIILGEEGNELTLTLDNDRISFKQSGQEVAYFANQKLYVTEGEFTIKAQIGNFAFVPGIENGNLSFKKVR